MSQKFNSTSERPWLKDNHLASSQRVVGLGQKVIDLLVRSGRPVTFSSISEESKKIDTKGKGIHENTIRTNQELYDYYKQHSATYKRKQNSNRTSFANFPSIEDTDYRKLIRERDLEYLKKKYMKLTKEELVKKLIHAELYIVENNKKWVTNHFEKFQ
ncbi:hypothetical protein ABE42_20530 [Bacillus thuringiensis]|uniref:Uncharacterized protein n=1 Tax=Bacillus thuringiensis TaxID=1428 RepID=A0A437SAY3_BACTU|nr:hypothetical protein [Bacillus thuringiensis]MBG9539578.1 hypothetical protein [Bacillus thuringiensis]MBG9581530.1 hypothetical protein [Bacillus thuringiensis]RVU60392.1 hypothetical protein BM74_31710 [Bacillus thuringiensis]